MKINTTDKWIVFYLKIDAETNFVFRNQVKTIECHHPTHNVSIIEMINGERSLHARFPLGSHYLPCDIRDIAWNCFFSYFNDFSIICLVTFWFKVDCLNICGLKCHSCVYFSLFSIYFCLNQNDSSSKTTFMAESG